MEDKFRAALKMGIIPVVAIDDVNNAGHLAEALIKGGLPCAEITFRTAAATEVIKMLSARKDLIVGAGTVLNTEQAKRAVDNGASFIVSPCLVTKVIRYCLDSRIPVVPGVSTPTEIGTALDMGLSILKFFPAEAFGGLATLSAISAPFSEVQFIPTGGIGPKNLIEYLRHSKVIACGGSWMVQSKLIVEKKFDEITRLTQEAVLLVSKARQL
jgi:2-dehydro-3-deoxyphosphogluconate aldolase/(4S)-4-hydroxy-2-oxoglutarate aldolase